MDPIKCCPSVLDNVEAMKNVNNQEWLHLYWQGNVVHCLKLLKDLGKQQWTNDVMDKK